MAKRPAAKTEAPKAVNKRTSIGNGRRKRGSFKGTKKYRGQGK